MGVRCQAATSVSTRGIEMRLNSKFIDQVMSISSCSEEQEYWGEPMRDRYAGSSTFEDKRRHAQATATSSLFYVMSDALNMPTFHEQEHARACRRWQERRSPSKFER